MVKTDVNSKETGQKQIKVTDPQLKQDHSDKVNETVTQIGGAQRKLQMEPGQPARKAWSTLMDLTFIPPRIVEEETIVELVQEDMDSEIDKWKYAAIAYVIGGSTTIGAMQRFVAAQGNFSAKPKVYYHNAGYFVINFSCLEERNLVIYSGPHMLNNRPVINKAWTADFHFYAEHLKTIPIWVKTPNLPLSCWSVNTLSKIGSGLGQLLYADACKSNANRISYARILVEIDVTRELPNVIKIKDPKDRMIEQKIWYDWKPTYCARCMQIGHNCQKQ